MKRNPGVWRPGIRTAPRFPKQAVQAAQEVETAAQRPIRAREQSATRARPSCPPPKPLVSESGGTRPTLRRHPSGVPPGRPRGASRPLRKARNPPAGRTDEPQLARSPPTWREFGPASTRRCLGPLDAQQPLARGAGVQSAAQRTAETSAAEVRRPHPGPRRPAANSAARGGRGGDVARGARHEARGARARRGRAAGARRAWSARSLGGGRKERAPSAASASYFLSGFLLEEEKHLFPASFVFLSAWRLDAGAYF